MATSCFGAGSHLDEEPLTRELPEVDTERSSSSNQGLKRASVIVHLKPKIGALVCVRTELILKETELSYDGGKKSILLEDFIGINIIPKAPSTTHACEVDVHHYPIVQQAKGDKPCTRKMAVVTMCFDGGATFKENLITAVDWKAAIKKQVHVAMRSTFEFADVNALNLSDDDSLLVPKHLLVFINPVAGKGKGVSIFENEVRPLFDLAEINYNVVVTERQGHAREVAKVYDFSRIHGIVVSSGDGLLYEIINGLMERDDWETAIKTPIGMLPTGSGNALCASVLYEDNEDFGLTDAAFQIVRGGVIPMDIATVHTYDHRTSYMALLSNWGMVADVDIESEKFRRIGESRFILGALYCIIKKRHYQAKVYYLPIEDCHDTHRDKPQELSAPPGRTFSQSSAEPLLDTTSAEDSQEGGGARASVGEGSSTAQEDGSASPLSQEEEGIDIEALIQTNGVITQGQVMLNGGSEVQRTGDSIIEPSTSIQQSSDGQATHSHGTEQANGGDFSDENDTSTPPTAVTTNGAASPQSTGSASNSDFEHKNIAQSTDPSERRAVSPIKSPHLAPITEDVPDDWLSLKIENFVSITGMMIPHMAHGFFGDPALTIGTGKIRLIYISGTLTRKDMLDVLTGADVGRHMTMEGVGFVDCKAFRLIPITPEGILTMDGEVQHYGPMQTEVHKHLGRVMCRRRREGGSGE